MKPFLLFLLLLPVFTSCRQSPEAYEYKPTPIEGWEPGDTVKFSTDTLRADGNYTLHLGIRSSASVPYPFQSIWLVVRQQWHRPEQILTDTIECRLTDEQGDIAGKGVSLYQYEMPIRQLQLNEGSYGHISIFHIMRREMLPGIATVGIKLERDGR